MRSIRIAALLTAILLCLPCLLLPVGAETMQVVFEENFDDYDVDVNGTATNLKTFFKLEANSIGDGFIKVVEDDNGNLSLRSHVFTQVVSKSGLTGVYNFSVTILSMGGGHQAGLFVRGVPTTPAFYEGDGGDPDNPHSEGFTGLWVYTHSDVIHVNIKSFDRSTTNNVYNNYHSFPLPEGADHPLDIRIEDKVSTIEVYAADQLICTLKISEEDKRIAAISDAGRFAKEVTMLDANGTEIMTVTDTLITTNGSYIGWATRVADMTVDNVKVEAMVAETESPTEAPTEPLTEAPTDAPTEEPTEIPTEAPGEAPTVADTRAPADTTAEISTAQDTEPIVSLETEVVVVDDSLAVWILGAVMLAVIGVTAGVLVVFKRK